MESYKMTSQEALDTQLGMIQSALSILLKKRIDYSGTEDPLANFRNSAMVGVSPAKGAFIRLMDKMQRIAKSLDRDLIGESVFENDFIDVINYVCIVALLKMEEDGNTDTMFDFICRASSLIETIEGMTNGTTERL